MKILIAPDKFKSSLTALEVAEAIEAGIYTIGEKLEPKIVPIADGGEGSLDILIELLDLDSIHLNVQDPIGNKVHAYYAMRDEEAFIELASASGLSLLNEVWRNPMHTSTYGTGQLIEHAILNGAKKINLFVGGSATNDAAIGIASALGYVFYDKSGAEVKPVGSSLSNIHDFKYTKVDPDYRDVAYSVYTDVRNPLFGIKGAAYTFAAQKGASEKELNLLDKGLKSFANLVVRKLNIDIAVLPGSGAAGGVAGGMFGLFNAEISSGVDRILTELSIENLLTNIALVITGEGKLDATTFDGKAISGLLTLCKQKNIPCIIITGKNEVPETKFEEWGIYKVLSLIHYARNEHDAINNAKQYIESLVRAELPAILKSINKLSNE